VSDITTVISGLDPALPVLIAGPTASGKSALALAVAERQGGVIVNADAMQVYSDWRVLTARPPRAEEARIPHALYGHVRGDTPYSVGRWLRDVAPLLQGGPRPVIVGGTGLYFTALTEGLARIPPTPKALRAEAERRLQAEGLAALLAELDAASLARIDTANPRRVTRAWEVLRATGRGLADWQAETPAPLLPLCRAQPLLVTAPKAWLTPRIEARLRGMLAEGALEEARANLDTWSPGRPSAKAIGATELMAHLRGEIGREAVVARAAVLTRQFAKRQRSWFRARMGDWPAVTAERLA
jgi:tRNA dimethylallyltransferase